MSLSKGKPEVGDHVWFYDANFLQCTEGVIIEESHDDLWVIQTTTYTPDGVEQKNTPVVRSIGEFWWTKEDCLNYIVQDFECELRRNTNSWESEQAEYKKKHDNLRITLLVDGVEQEVIVEPISVVKVDE